MGYARWDPDDWKAYAGSAAAKPTATLFSARGLHPDLDPARVRLRESRDSARNPLSTPIVAALDVTGSMGMIADALARRGLGTLVEEILDRRPVSDPHVLCMGIGDAWADDAPLQVTEFEADISIARQLERLWLEKGGGGNDYESYNLAWWFAAMRTASDSWEKRGRKGYLFTVGDEEPPPVILAAHLQRFLEEPAERDLTTRDLLTLVERTWHVFHVVVEEGSHFRACSHQVLSKWQQLLGQRVLRLADHTRLAETVVSAIEVAEGRDAAAVTASWPADVAKVVGRALAPLHAGVPAKRPPGKGVVRFR